MDDQLVGPMLMEVTTTNVPEQLSSKKRRRSDSLEESPQPQPPTYRPSGLRPQTHRSKRTYRRLAFQLPTSKPALRSAPSPNCPRRDTEIPVHWADGLDNPMIQTITGIFERTEEDLKWGVLCTSPRRDEPQYDILPDFSFSEPSHSDDEDNDRDSEGDAHMHDARIDDDTAAIDDDDMDLVSEVDTILIKRDLWSPRPWMQRYRETTTWWNVDKKDEEGDFIIVGDWETLDRFTEDEWSGEEVTEKMIEG